MWRIASISILGLLGGCRMTPPPVDLSVAFVPDAAGHDASVAVVEIDAAAPGGSSFDAASAEVSSLASFFVSSRGGGRGGDLRAGPSDVDGLAGADALCATLAQAASPVLAARSWRAYLSTRTVDARDRIGTGPWYNLRGVLIASDVAALHEDNGSKNGIERMTALDELGHVLYGLDPPPGKVNEHDILTGSNVAGRLLSGDDCDDWTRSQGGRARVGHSDRTGGSSDSWNSVHDSDGCAESGADSVRSAGGRGSIYCFALPN